MVRYSAEQGVFGPGMRVAGAIALALALLAAGEVLRRRLRGTMAGSDSLPPSIPTWPDVPAVVTAAGIAALFGALYAAHALYGFLGPLAAFSGLAATGLAAMAAALLHGPVLAGLGLVGAMATPLLIGGGSASLWPLALYLPVVAGSAYGFAWLRGWRALAVAGGLGAAAWSVLLASTPRGPDRRRRISCCRARSRSSSSPFCRAGARRMRRRGPTASPRGCSPASPSSPGRCSA